MPVDLKQSKLKKKYEVKNGVSQEAGRKRQGPGRPRSKSIRPSQPMMQKLNNDQKSGRAVNGKLAQVYAKVDKAEKKMTDDKAIIPKLQYKPKDEGENQDLKNRANLPLLMQKPTVIVPQ